MNMAQTGGKATDEIYCAECGEAIKKKAEICPHCGVRNSPRSEQDETESEVTISDSWWIGVAGGTGLWVLVWILSTSVAEVTLGLLAITAWILLPLSVYFDIKHVKANAEEWRPNVVVWFVLSAIWLINIIVGLVYLYKRSSALDSS